MARAAGALQQARHALGRANLQHALDRQKINAQVQTGRADDRLERAVFQPRLHPVAHRSIQRTVMQRQHTSPVRPRLQHRLVPQLGLCAGVGKHQRRAAGIDFFDNLRQHRQTQVASPGKTLDALGQQRVDAQRLG